ncbi:VOC family protein [Hyphococcus sp.]|uniref:VOC family protein n=1 Tax=Hyphococcus sp. TaxID=2038636 RepID=UPI0035C6C371
MSCPIRYKRLGFAVLSVTNLDESTEFYADRVGLLLSKQGDGKAFLRCSEKPFDLLLEEGETAGLKRVGFELESVAVLDNSFPYIAELGFEPEWLTMQQLDELNAAAGYRFMQPETGLEIDFYAEQQPVAEPFEPTVTNIARLGHVVLNVSSYAKAHDFWVTKLGFAISDHVPGKISFLRCFPNPLHHTFALLEGPWDGLNHINFMVTDIDDIGCAMNRMKKADVPIVFGPGRHLPSTSIFLYFLDPDGMTAEYSFGMEEIPEDNPRAPRELEPKPEVLDTWGSIADPRFGKGGVIVGSNA